MKTKFALIAGFLAAGLLFGQDAPSPGNDEKPPLPNPILRRAPDLAQWMVTTKAVNEPAGGEGQRKQSPQTETIVKSGKTYHMQSVDTNGTHWDKWNIDGMQVTFREGGNDFNVASTGSGQLHTDFSQSDFPDMSWISAASYKGLKKAKGFEGYLFQEEITAEETNEVFVREAVVDRATQLPVYTRLSNLITIYKFDESPSATVVLPPKVVEVLKAQQAFAAGKTR